MGREAYIQYINKSDETVQKALELLEKGEAFPKPPTPEELAQEEEETQTDEGTEKRTAQADSSEENPVLRLYA